MALQTPSRPTVAERSVRSGEDHAHLRRTIVSIVAMVAMLAAGFLLGRYLAPSSVSVPAQPTAAAPPEAAPLTGTRREVLPHPGPAIMIASAPVEEPNRNVREGRVSTATGGGLQGAREPSANVREGRFDPHATTVVVAEPNANAREGRIGPAAGGGLQSGYADPLTLSRHFGLGTAPGPISHSRLGPVHRRGV